MQEWKYFEHGRKLSRVQWAVVEVKNFSKFYLNGHYVKSTNSYNFLALIYILIVVGKNTSSCRDSLTPNILFHFQICFNSLKKYFGTLSKNSLRFDVIFANINYTRKGVTYDVHLKVHTSIFTEILIWSPKWNGLVRLCKVLTPAQDNFDPKKTDMLYY